MSPSGHIAASDPASIPPDEELLEEDAAELDEELEDAVELVAVEPEHRQVPHAPPKQICAPSSVPHLQAC